MSRQHLFQARRRLRGEFTSLAAGGSS
jgi:hypothetical protein